MMRTFARVSAAGALALGVVSMGGAAQAVTYTVIDAKHDVFSYDANTGHRSAAPRQATADITRFRLQHGKRTITLSVQLRHLKPRDFALYFLVATPDTSRAPDHIDFVRERALSKHVFVDLTDHRGSPIRCALHPQVDGSRNLLTLSFSRTCLGSPRWIRVGVSAFASDRKHEWADVSERDGLRASDISGPPLGPRVAAG